MTTDANMNGLGARLRRIVRHVFVLLAAAMLTAAFFLVLPLIQVISQKPADTMQIAQVDTVQAPPPPPPPPEEPEEEPEPEEPPPPPELADEIPPLDLDLLSNLLNAGTGDGWGVEGFDLDLDAIGGRDEVAALFNVSDLDQEPRIIQQVPPTVDAKVRRLAPGTVTIIFIVDERGRVQNPIVKQSGGAALSRSALAAIRQWRFEPGRRDGEPVSVRMRRQIIFPEGL